MRLATIHYYAGKDLKSGLILIIGIDEYGKLIGLRSDKLSDQDVKKIRANMKDLAKLSADELKEVLKNILSSYNSALVEMNRDRYKLVEEHNI